MRSLLTAGLLLLSGCNPFAMWGQATAQRNAAEQATVRFHQLLDSTEYALIYSEVDQGFRDAMTEKDANALWRMIQRRFGPVQGTTLANWNVSYTTSNGTVVRLVYRTGFAKDSAVETFMWRIHDHKPALLGYNINSPALQRALLDEKN